MKEEKAEGVFEGKGVGVGEGVVPLGMGFSLALNTLNCSLSSRKTPAAPSCAVGMGVARRRKRGVVVLITRVSEETLL